MTTMRCNDSHAELVRPDLRPFTHRSSRAGKVSATGWLAWDIKQVVSDPVLWLSGRLHQATPSTVTAGRQRAACAHRTAAPVAMTNHSRPGSGL